MTYRNFGPESLNAGRVRRQILPSQQQKNEPFAVPSFASQASAGSAAQDLTRELEAIANELNRLKSSQPAHPHASPISVPHKGFAQNGVNQATASFDASQIVSLVQSLKSDVRIQMRDDLDAQYVRLREELDGLNSAIAGTSLHGSFKNEISELLVGLENLASSNRSIQSSQDKLSGYLQRELGDLQTSLQGLAKNDSLTKLDKRWNSLENRWNSLETRLDKGLSQNSNASLVDISARLAALQDKMNESGLEPLENRMLMLARSVDALAQSRSTGANVAVDFSKIDHRFDELTRAVAAIGLERATPSIDSPAIEQIEKAIGLLGRKLELIGTMTGQNPSLHAIETRLSQLNERFAELPEYFNHAPVMERIDRLADTVSALPAPSLSTASIDALTDQLNALAKEVRGNSGAKPIAEGLLNRLDDRLGSIEDRLSGLTFGEAGTADNHGVIAALEDRFAELSAHLEAMQFEAIQPQRDAAKQDSADFSALERKLGDIAHQLSQSPEPSVGSASFSRLESQIADLSMILARQPQNGGEAIAERFQSLENLLSKNQHAVLDIARKAAEEAALRLQTNSTNSIHDSDNSHIVGVIAGELATLEQLTRSSNERSTSAFEGIHGALLHIADRLASLETKPAAAGVARTQADAHRTSAGTMAFAQDAFFAPSLEATENDLGDLGHLDIQNEPMARKVRSPSEMAQEAANAAVKNIDPQAAAAAAAVQSLPGGELEDVPLSPGTGAPDLNSILKRVRDQKKATQSQVAKDVDRKDHFLSIKRAAQAAANEVQHVEIAPNTNGALANLKSLYAKLRRPILMIAAAAIVAIAAIQLTSALVSNDAEQISDASTQLQIPAQLPAPLGQSEATNDEALKEISNIEPQAAETESTPRIVGTDTQQASDTAPETAIIAATQNAAADETQASQTATSATSASDANRVELESPVAVALPEIPAGFGPQALITAAKTNDMKAQFELGRRLAENQNEPALLASAFGWFNAAAGQGFAPAQYRVGNMYEKGLGVERSATEAKLWYQMAAEAGNASAMHNLAVLFASGADGTVDSASALRWFQKAADLGVGDSQFNLGVMKGKGQGVPQDLEESYKWLAILAKSGDVEAAAKRDEVAKTMRPEQIDAAKAKIELWKPQPAVPEANDLSIPDDWKIATATTASVDVKKAVKNVQLILTKLGYNVGKADGVMGENTRKAIRAFQQKQKLTVNGEIDGPLVKALLAKNG